jgi:hypothetical protein
LGDGSTTNRNYPAQVGTATNWEKLSTEGNHVLAIKSTGQLWGWGLNNFGQLGDGTTVNKSLPFQIGTDTDWFLSIAGSNNSFVLKNNNVLSAWGENSYGQLLDGTSIVKYFPTPISCTSLGLTETNFSNKFQIYPNPTTEILNIQNKLNLTIEKIIVSDITGKFILEQTDNNETINIKNFKTGIYIIKIIVDKTFYCLKFIKQ